MSVVRRNIAFFAEDMGACLALLPVFLRLQAQKKHKVTAIFGSVCKAYIAPHLGRYIAKTADPDAEVDACLSAFCPDVVVVGISVGVSLDKSAIRWARQYGIPSVGIVESWGDTICGFSSPGTRDMDRVPDRICVLDDFLKQRMKTEGFDSSNIVVTGSPHFDSFATRPKKHVGKKAIYFFCQPFSELPNLDTGLNEVSIFADLVQALEKLQVDHPLIVRFHPRTKRRHKFDDIIARSSLHISIDRSKVMETALARVELVLGMFGAALFEAALMGKKVLSYLPTLTIPDPLMSNKLGLSVPVYQKKELIPKLKKLLERPLHEDSLAAVRHQYVHGHATENVIRCIESVL